MFDMERCDVTAEITRLRKAMSRAADIIDNNLHRQNEKVADASSILRDALDANSN
jgi:hypothetical protein